MRSTSGGLRRSVKCLLEEVRKTIQAFGLLADGQSVVVAVSGGLDSMVLLNLLHQLSKRYRWNLSVAHFNHQLRGEKSDGDQTFVHAVAERLGLRFLCEKGDVRAHARDQGISIEMAARELRHAFLARCAAASGGQTVALAHHANDQSELFFLRLFRGAGTDGIAGMDWRRPSPYDPSVRLLRPLLGIPKRELEIWAKRNRIVYSDDATNEHLDRLRNRIRHELLPHLRKHYQPGLDQTIHRFMELAREDSNCLDQASRSLADSTGFAFDRLHVALQRRRIRSELLRLGIKPEFEMIEYLRLNLGGKLTVCTGLVVFRTEDGELSTLDPDPVVEFSTEETVLNLAVPSGSVVFGGARIQWQVESAAFGVYPHRDKEHQFEHFDASRVGSSIVLRRWRPGDRFQPIGMPNSVKLQSLFVNNKIPRGQRHTLIVGVTADGEIFWVEGLRISERFKLKTETENRLTWIYSRTTGG